MDKYKLDFYVHDFFLNFVCMWIAAICLYTSDVNSCLGLSVILKKKYSGIKLCEQKLSLYYYNSSFSLFISLLQKLASNNNNSSIFFSL